MADEEDKMRCNICFCKFGNCIFPQRYVVVLLMVIAITVGYMQRVCISLAIVKMVPPVHSEAKKPECDAYTFTSTTTGNATEKLDDVIFEWSESVQNYILLSFYFGYMLGNIPAGFLTDNYGARWFMFAGMTLSTITTGVFPILAYYTHWVVLVVARVIAGFGQSVLFPGAGTIISRWIPDNKKSTIGSILLNSFTLGTILGTLFTGFIIKWSNTWRWVYYSFAALGCGWMVLFYFYGFSSPESHKHVTKGERELLEAEIPKVRRLPLPLIHICTDLAVWAFIICQFGNDYILYVFMTNIPKYFTDVLHVDVATTATLLTFPPIACFIGSITIGPIGDLCIAKGMKKVYYRIIATLIAVPVASFCILMVSFSRCNLVMVNIFVCLTMFCKAAFYSGAGLTCVDISLNFSGFILGVGNAAGSFAGMVAPFLISTLAPDSTLAQWRTVNAIAAIITVVSVLPYLVFVKGYRKEWDYPEGEKPEFTDDEKVSKCKRVMCCYRLV